MDSEGIYIVANSREFKTTVANIFQKNIPTVSYTFFNTSDELIDLLCSPQTNRLPSVIMLANYMAGSNALNILQHLKKSQGQNPEFLKRIPVIVLVGDESNADIIACYRAGANAVLRKPEDHEGLTNTFLSICDFWMTINTGPEFRKSGTF